MQKFIEQIVDYHRRYNLLNNLMGASNQAKEALREKEYLLQKNDGNLLGKEISSDIILWK